MFGPHRNESFIIDVVHAGAVSLPDIKFDYFGIERVLKSIYYGKNRKTVGKLPVILKVFYKDVDS